MTGSLNDIPSWTRRINDIIGQYLRTIGVWISVDIVRLYIDAFNNKISPNMRIRCNIDLSIFGIETLELINRW